MQYHNIKVALNASIDFFFHFPDCIIEESLFLCPIVFVKINVFIKRSLERQLFLRSNKITTEEPFFLPQRCLKTFYSCRFGVSL